MVAMKALTIWQPWASLIMAGWKPYEFRGWRAPQFVIDQRIVIHAGARQIKKTEVAELIIALDKVRFVGGLKIDAVDFLSDVLMDRRTLPLSAGLGTALLGEPKQSHELWPDQFEGMSDSDRENVSNWAWPLTEIQPFEPIVPAKGRQGFWSWVYS